MTVAELIALLGEEIEDVDEETFLLFSQSIPSQNLGFIDPKAASLELTVANKSLTIHQAPGLLSSNRAGGTTGAVVWKITPPFATWLASPSNPLFRTGMLSSASTVLELGCGISAIVGLAVAPYVTRYILSDQSYVHRFVEQNIAENISANSTASSASSSLSHHHQQREPRNRSSGKAKHGSRGSSSKALKGAATTSNPAGGEKLVFRALDWETDEVSPSLFTTISRHVSSSLPPAQDFDAVVACDCIYNEALIVPFVETCAAACRLRVGGDDYNNNDNENGCVDAYQLGSEISTEDNHSKKNTTSEPPRKRPCICVVAQQLRSYEVFESWIRCFSRSFRVWRIPDELLDRNIQSDSGFVVHVGLLR